MTENDPNPSPSTTRRSSNGASPSLITDAAIVAAPTAAVTPTIY
jgi:hypothetical protein